MQPQYHAQTVEDTAQAFWTKHRSFEVTEKLDQPSFYCLSMLPYPSGELHMGHVRNYTLGDVITRIKIMQKYNVLQPLGWDAFGLPAENAAIKHQVSPQHWTLKNINTMRTQLKRMGLGIDWSREIQTCLPEYYRWNQWLFLQMFNKGLVYQRESTVNWDPVDNTVLANEQVIDGRGWRSDALVEKRKIRQWFFKITAYADELLDGLDALEGWPQEIITMQRHWMGRAQGVDVHFPVIDQPEPLIAFTTRIDTLFGVSYLAISADHPLAHIAAQTSENIRTFIENSQQTDTSERTAAIAEKKGIATSFLAHHPLTGNTLPIWICNYVMMDYGTGCVMGVPAHDLRDHAFARKYTLPILPVIQPPKETTTPWDFTHTPWVEPQGTLINSDAFNTCTIEQAQKQIAQCLHQQASGGQSTTYRLRDWGVSRQRYWGTPIPIIHCDHCGVVPVPESELPVILPLDLPMTKTGAQLAQHNAFVETNCPNCHAASKRETDTMDTFVDSSWYYARYACADQNQLMLDDRAKYWTPVDQYIGGIEHANMHLLYARFIHKVLRDIGLINSDEPFQKLLAQGMVLKDGKKMSKSKGNVITPMPLIEQYGADTLRLFSIFTAPPEQTLEWHSDGVEGAQRFLNRFWSLCYQWKEAVIGCQTQPPLEHFTQPNLVKLHSDCHLIVKQLCFDVERQQFNTVVSAVMKLVNLISELTPDTEPTETAWLAHEILSIMIRALAPITPHICHVLWQVLGYGDNVLEADYPQEDSQAIQRAQITLIIQINGKLRGQLCIDAQMSKDKIIESACALDNIKKYLSEKSIKKTIFVPGKLINFVL